MVADKNQDEKVAELKKQVEMLQQQLALINSQVALDIAKQTQESLLSKTMAEALKNQATAQFEQASEQAKLPFAELVGIKAGLGDAKLPEGKSGSIQFAAGTVGTALLRSKRQMLELLDLIASELSRMLPNGAVMITEAQLEQAYRARFVLKTIKDQTQKLNSLNNQALPKATASTMGLAPLLAGAYSVGMVMDTVNSLAKLFRVDRKIDIFAADAEAKELLGYLLEAKNSKFVANPALMNEAVTKEAEELLQSLNELLEASQSAKDTIEQLKKIEDEAKTKPPSIQLPSADIVSSLKAKLDAAKSLLEGLDPGKKADDFWSQVKGQLILRATEGKARLLLEAKAQAIQITESRWWRSDRICSSGEVQIAYRILDKDGKIEKTGVVLKASRVESNAFLNAEEVNFPQSQ